MMIVYSVVSDGGEVRCYFGLGNSLLCRFGRWGSLLSFRTVVLMSISYGQLQRDVSIDE